MLRYIEKVVSGYNTYQFLDRFQQLYETHIFRNFLNFILTIAKNEKLKIVISKRIFFDEELGFCQTNDSSYFDKMLNFVTKKKYVIKLNVITASVIIHEFAHLIEKEININIIKTFIPIISIDFKSIEKINIVMKNKIKNLFIDSLDLYEESHKMGEIFARYFELYAATSDISGKESIYIKDIDSIFVNTKKWFLEFDKLLISNTDSEILKYSTQHKILDNLKSKVAHKYTEYNHSTKKWGEIVPSYLGEDNIKQDKLDT